ncbi:hypothetical protein P4S63_22435 [Pseudoalteromonas sp. B193]
MSGLAKLQQQFMDLLQGESSDISEQIAQQGQLNTLTATLYLSKRFIKFA